MIHYYNLRRSWPRVAKFIDHPSVRKPMLRDMHKYYLGFQGRPFTKDMKPIDACSGDWRFRGRYLSNDSPPFPKFWDYCCKGACHWVVNFTLELAKLVLPKRSWRIVSSDAHSTVWDGAETVFDFNFQALGMPAEYTLTAAKKKGRVLPIGTQLRVYPAAHWSKNDFYSE